VPQGRAGDIAGAPGTKPITHFMVRVWHAYLVPHVAAGVLATHTGWHRLHSVNRLTHSLLSLLVTVTLLTVPLQPLFAMPATSDDSMQMHERSGVAHPMPMDAADQHENTHDCDCCPPGTCHSASMSCSTGQCGSCTFSIIALPPSQTPTLADGHARLKSVSAVASPPDSLYRPPRS